MSQHNFYWFISTVLLGEKVSPISVVHSFYLLVTLRFLVVIYNARSPEKCDPSTPLPNSPSIPFVATRKSYTKYSPYGIPISVCLLCEVSLIFTLIHLSVNISIMSSSILYCIPMLSRCSNVFTLLISYRFSRF